ncbi:hypothetical protein JEU11_05190 [Paraglaciecola chathamensis]|uniref:Uncharacterized protein n=1 Tax=Paraglaciecola chathamensis TaxID=368405 RepID=A0ABS0WBP8_9ALTE|nr:hypothetical protein [Paraglaciecola chathamensis]MBJ2135843.1 hypothetical protein [Paraglaciecola chathamensis]MDO6561661.1 hypothetical protein [Paraglaciecola chathamensis]MDO6841755.1 hypothetical protein [Paraglaciecola chathamensis]
MHFTWVSVQRWLQSIKGTQQCHCQYLLTLMLGKALGIQVLVVISLLLGVYGEALSAGISIHPMKSGELIK